MFNAGNSASLSGNNFPIAPAVPCRMVSMTWEQITTKVGLTEGLILEFKTKDGHSLKQTLFDVTYETVFVFDDENREDAFARKAKEINYVVNSLLYAYGKGEEAEHLQADSCKEFCLKAIEILSPVQFATKDIWLKTVIDSKGYVTIPKYGFAQFVQLNSGEPCKLVYSKYESDYINKIKKKLSSTSESIDTDYANSSVEFNDDVEEFSEEDNTQPTEEKDLNEKKYESKDDFVQFEQD